MHIRITRPPLDQPSQHLVAIGKHIQKLAPRLFITLPVIKISGSPSRGLFARICRKYRQTAWLWLALKTQGMPSGWFSRQQNGNWLRRCAFCHTIYIETIRLVNLYVNGVAINNRQNYRNVHKAAFWLLSVFVVSMMMWS